MQFQFQMIKIPKWKQLIYGMSFQAQKKSQTTIWWLILQEITASEEKGHRAEQGHKKEKRISQSLQRSLIIDCLTTNVAWNSDMFITTYHYEGTDVPRRPGTERPLRILGCPIFLGILPDFCWAFCLIYFGHSRNSKFFGGPLPCPSTLAAPGNMWCSEILGINSGQIDAK